MVPPGMTSASLDGALRPEWVAGNLDQRAVRVVKVDGIGYLLRTEIHDAPLPAASGRCPRIGPGSPR